MNNEPKYYIIDAAVLPEVFRKVAEAKRLLATGEANTVNEATKLTDLSRSAYYKYRDTVMPFQSMASNQIVTFQLVLLDNPGILSGILNIFAQEKCNILTINQSIPSHGSAVTTIAAVTADMSISLEAFLGRLNTARGVVHAEVVAG